MLQKGNIANVFFDLFHSLTGGWAVEGSVRTCVPAKRYNRPMMDAHFLKHRIQ